MHALAVDFLDSRSSVTGLGAFPALVAGSRRTPDAP